MLEAASTWYAPGWLSQRSAVYTPSFVKALVAGIKAALGIAPTKKTTAETLQWFQWGQAMGHLVYDYARETAALDDEVSELYGAIDYARDVETEETYGKFVGSPGQPLSETNFLRVAQVRK